MQDVHDLGLVLDAHFPIIIIRSREEDRVLDMLRRLAIKRGKSLHRWSITDGLEHMGFGLELESHARHKEPDEVLQHIRNASVPHLFALCDFHPYLDDEPRRVRLIKDIALNHANLGHQLVFISHAFKVPEEIRHYCAYFELSLPSDAQIMQLIRDEANRWSSQNQNRKVKTDNRTLEQLVSNLKGVTLQEVKHLVRGAIVEDGAITQADISEVNKAKFQLMDMEGVLSFEYDTASFNDVAGLDNLKDWLQKRKHAFLNDETEHLDPPKGIMLLGVQGGGKSLAAKAVAATWNLPLLRLDFGTLYNKFFGETERNLREALKLAETMSPCVVWIDEIEKGLGQDGNDQGVSKRVLGTLLTWMAERKQPVFMVATANSIQTLPPELMRKGRLDEIFFVDLPDAEVRQAIFRIHLNKRGHSADAFDLAELANRAEGFSGAEIEQSIVAALYTASADAQTLNTDHIAEELGRTVPLSVLRAEDMTRLRHWAAERTVKA